MYFLSFLILALAAVCSAQVPFLGQCPNVSPKTDFDVAQYVGKWYEQEKYFAIFQIGGKCTTATYISNSGGIGVTNQQINVLTGASTAIFGSAVFTGSPTEARLQVSFYSSLAKPAPYWVLDTDYTSYAVVYACDNQCLFNTRFLWILTRQSRPDASTLQKAYAVIDRNGLCRSFLIKTDQVNCPAYT